ncbi:hypothetical protein DRQ09_08795 [candidate division KSB1 bacterium]|nr:MAG: hypothetical protein DRQ09_08795 [candidate division KSB1 bacterium]
MEIAYSGKLLKIPEFGTFPDQETALDDRINSEMVELAVYSCWYPYWSFGNKFDISLEVSLPEEWKCVCSGRKTKEVKENNRVVSWWSSKKDIDIVVIASPELKNKTVKTSSGIIDVYYSKLPEKYIIKETNEIEKSLNLFTSLLGKPHISGSVVKHVYSPKKKGQGSISRAGMIITSEGRILDELTRNQDISYLHSIAHEIAHFWWNFGTGQGDWINETFAEYFSLIAIREISSKKRFDEYIDKYKKMVEKLPEDAPSLSEVPPVNDNNGYIIRYYKGSLMLDYFRELLGDKKFFKICKDFYIKFNEIGAGTSQFKDFWSKRLGKHRAMLDVWLNAKGGLNNLKLK